MTDPHGKIGSATIGPFDLGRRGARGVHQHQSERHLQAELFEGPIMPVNPEEQAVAGVLAYPEIDALPVTPDLAVICTPLPTVAASWPRQGP